MPFAPLTDEQIEDMMTYHAPTDDMIAKFEAIRQAAIYFATQIRDNCPLSADSSAAIRLVREARMTANAAIALGGRY